MPKALLVLGAAMISVGCAHRSEGETAPEIEKLRFDGTKQLSQRKIEDAIVTAATGWWWPFAEKHYYDPFVWQTDLRRIPKIYEAGSGDVVWTKHY